MDNLIELYYKKKIVDEIDYLSKTKSKMIKHMKEKNERFITIDGVELIFDKVISSLEGIVKK